VDMMDHPVGFKIIDCLLGFEDMEDNSVDLILTDPPYNKGKQYEGNFSDNKPEKEFRRFNRKWITECLRILKPGRHFYFTCASDQIWYFKGVCEDIGFKFRHLLIWSTGECKGHMNSRTWLRSYEPVFWFQKPGGTYGLFNNFPLAAFDVIRIYSPHKNSKGDDKKFHVCQKPILLWDTIITKSSMEGDFILDPFLGSGTTLVSAVKNNRSCFGFELSEEYRPMIEKRLKKALMDYSGRQSDLKSF